MTKIVKRLDRHIEIFAGVRIIGRSRPARLPRGKKDRHLADVARPSNWEASRRVELARKHVGNRVSCLDSKKPSRDDGPRPCQSGRDYQWPPGRKHKHNRLAEIE